jgi:hypothetical protein
MKQMLKLAAHFGGSNREFRRNLCSEHAHSETGRCREGRLSDSNRWGQEFTS